VYLGGWSACDHLDLADCCSVLQNGTETMGPKQNEMASRIGQCG
jgi:hypothetical protein